MQSAQTELDFINLYLESLSSKSVRYGEDYMSRTLPSPLRIKVCCYSLLLVHHLSEWFILLKPCF